MSSKSPPLSQQAFLLEAMRLLEMNVEEFAQRLGATPQRIQSWLAPSGCTGSHELDAAVWSFVREILQAEAKVV